MGCAWGWQHTVEYGWPRSTSAGPSRSCSAPSAPGSPPRYRATSRRRSRSRVPSRSTSRLQGPSPCTSGDGRIPEMASVARINVTPVKGLGLQHPNEVDLTERGVESNRRYYLISGWRLYNGKDFGPLVRIAPEVDNRTLTLRFPDGREVEGEVELGEPVTTNFWGRPVNGRLVHGPWADVLSDYAATALQLVRT